MSRFQVGQIVFTGGQYAKITKLRDNGVGEFEGHRWVKSKQEWTAKTSLWGYNGSDHYQILTNDEAKAQGLM